jgi:hypothetical protein
MRSDCGVRRDKVTTDGWAARGRRFIIGHKVGCPILCHLGRNIRHDVNICCTK